jgi:hypothetical protein
LGGFCKYRGGSNPLFKSKFDGCGKLLGDPSKYCWYCPFTVLALTPDNEYPGCPEALACNVDWLVVKGLMGGLYTPYAVKPDPFC